MLRLLALLASFTFTDALFNFFGGGGIKKLEDDGGAESVPDDWRGWYPIDVAIGASGVSFSMCRLRHDLHFAHPVPACSCYASGTP